MGVNIEYVVDIEVSDERIINRLSGRRVCEECGRPYHLVNLKPKQEGVCDACGGTLVQRKDDHIDTIKNRLEIYHKETEPLVEYYKNQGKLQTVHGSDKVEDTMADMMKIFEA